MPKNPAAVVRSSGWSKYGVYCECGFTHTNMPMKYAKELAEIHNKERHG